MVKALFNWLRASWDTVRTSLWVIPALMFLVGIVLAFVMLRFGSIWPSADALLAERLDTGSGEDARNLLSTLLGALIGMASIIFSITVVSLSLAANSYGPRLIRTFRASRSTQVAIGVFMLTIVYVLLVLRAVHGDSSEQELPEAAIAFGTFLSLIAILALLVFIQGVATLMVADEVVRRVRGELDGTIRELPPLAGDECTGELPDDFEDRAARIRLPREGYVKSVEFKGIVEWAAKRDSIVRLDFRPGDFVVEGDHKLLVYPAPDDAEQARRDIDRFIASGQQRTPTQDIEFAIRHLVEVAVRALSPGINDPFTAIAVIDRLRGAVARLCKRQLPPPQLFDDSGQLRVVRSCTSFRGLVDAAFDQIRQAGSGKPSILVHMLEAIGAMAEHTRTEEQREALAHHARLVMRAGERELSEESDREDVEREFRKAMAALSQARTRSGEAVLAGP